FTLRGERRELAAGPGDVLINLALVVTAQTGLEGRPRTRVFAQRRQLPGVGHVPSSIRSRARCQRTVCCRPASPQRYRRPFGHLPPVRWAGFAERVQAVTAGRRRRGISPVVSWKCRESGPGRAVRRYASTGSRATVGSTVSHTTSTVAEEERRGARARVSA